jgi:hypothetical protein
MNLIDGWVRLNQNREIYSVARSANTDGADYWSSLSHRIPSSWSGSIASTKTTRREPSLSPAHSKTADYNRDATHLN